MSAQAVPSAGPRFGTALALALATASFLCFSLPVLLYTGNRLEFATPLADMLLPTLAPALLASVLFALLAAALPARARGRLVVLTAALCLLVWLQGTVLVWEYGLFDGGRIDWSLARWRGFVDAGLWLFVLLAADAWRERLVHVLPRLAIVACLLQSVLALVSLANGDAQAPAPRTNATAAALAGFSAQGNVLHILADGMQTDIVEDLLAEDEGRLAHDFSGFTLFEDNLGAFPYTHMSVPAMLSGLAYDNTEAQAPFLERALGQGSIFAAAKAAGYEVEVGEPGGGLIEVYRHASAARLYTLPDAPVAGWRGARQERLLLGDLVLFRMVPHFVKSHVYNDESWLLQGLFGSTAVPGRIFLAHETFLREFAAQARADSARPQYKFLHLMLSHRPMVMNRDCSYAGRVLEPNRAHVRDQARCAFRALSVVLARLRQLGIYENTTVVISGDHGTFVAPLSLASGSAEAARAYARALPPLMIGQARPLLLVKPAHARGALQRSSAPSWITDTPATIADAAGIPAQLPGVSALRLGAAETRERRYRTYDYLYSDWSAQHLAPMQEYLVRGRSDRVDSWSLGRRLEAGAAR